MGNNAHYWTDRQNLSTMARAHSQAMQDDYATAIAYSVNNSFVFDAEIMYSIESPASLFAEPGAVTRQYVLQDTTTNAIFRLKDVSEVPIVLNFASYTNPGGCFLEGSKAQEECLCHSSFLYNVLTHFQEYYDWNNSHKNRGLYMHRAIYSPEIYFFNKTATLCGDKDIRKVDVVTCAAPNNSLRLRYKSFTPEENTSTLKDRIKFIRRICLETGRKTVILGAWGCGVFRQDPCEVASLFKEIFSDSGLTVIYAVPDEATFNVFKSVINAD